MPMETSISRQSGQRDCRFAQPWALRSVEAGGESADADGIARLASAIPNELSLFGTSHARQSVL
jgi:hypothetical protein